MEENQKVQVHLLVAQVKCQKTASRKFVKRVKLSWKDCTSFSIPANRQQDKQRPFDIETLRLGGYSDSWGKNSGSKERFSKAKLSQVWVNHFKQPSVSADHISYSWKATAPVEPNSSECDQRSIWARKSPFLVSHEISVTKHTACQTTCTPLKFDAVVGRDLGYQLREYELGSLMNWSYGFEWKYSYTSDTYFISYEYHHREISAWFIRMSNVPVYVPSSDPREIILYLLSLTQLGGTNKKWNIDDYPFK